MYTVRRRSRPAFQQVLQEVAQRDKQAPRATFVDKCRICYQQYAKFLTKYSRLASAKLRLRTFPSSAEVLRQAEVLCKDYIYHKLKKQSLLSLKLEIIIGQSSRFRPTGVAMEVIALATELERLYPDLYQNVSRQLLVTMSSAEVVSGILQKMSDVLFESELKITWGRIIALFCISAAIATDCVKQGQAKLVKVVIATFKTIVQRKLASWIILQGGWSDIEQVRKNIRDGRGIWLLTGLGVLSGCLATLLYMS